MPLLGLVWVGLKAIIGGAIAWLVANAGSIVASILVTLGLYFFVAAPASDLIGDQLQAAFTGAPGTVLETLYYLNVDDYVTMVVSAFTLKQTYEAGKRVTLARRSGGTVT